MRPGKLVPGEFRRFVERRLRIVGQARLDAIPRVKRGRAPTSATHIVASGATTPSVEHPPIFREGEHPGLVVPVGMARPRPIAEVSAVLVKKDLDEASLPTSLSDLMVGIADRGETELPVFLSFCGETLRFARDCERLAPSFVNPIECSRFRIAS